MGFYKGIEYINKYGSRYDLYSALSLQSIFTSELTKGVLKKKDGFKGRLREIYKLKDSKSLAGNIYFNFLLMMARDAIDGHIAEMTPRRFPVIHVGPISEQASVPLRDKASEHTKVDLRVFNYRYPRVMFYFGPQSRLRDRVMNVPKEDFNRMNKNINEGKRYVEFKPLKEQTL